MGFKNVRAGGAKELGGRRRLLGHLVRERWMGNLAETMAGQEGVGVGWV